jgi:hypothetical protein
MRLYRQNSPPMTDPLSLREFRPVERATVNKFSRYRDERRYGKLE